MFLFFLFFQKYFSDSLVETGIYTEWFSKSDDSYIFISTADGRIHKIDILSGQVLWSVDSGGGVFNYTSTGRTVFIPSIDGFLFTFMRDYGYRRVSLPIRDLVFIAPFRTETGEIFSSGKSTSVYFIDHETGEIISSYKSNTTIPAQNGEQLNFRDLILVRVDYELNIFDATSEIIKVSEFDVFSGAKYGKTVLQNIKVMTTFNGAISISVNGTITSQLKLNSVPTSVFGSEGKYTYELVSNGAKLPRTNVLFLRGPNCPVAIPAKPLTTPSKFEILMSGMPALPGDKGVENRQQFGYGLFDVRRPFASFKPLRPQIDPTRPADQMIEPLNFIRMPRTHRFPYLLVGIGLSSTYFFLRFIEFLIRRMITVESSHISIIIDQHDETKGYYGDLVLSIVKLPYTDRSQQSLTLAREARDLKFTSSLIKDQIIEDTVVLGYQYMFPFDFKKMDPKLFLHRMLSSLESVFRAGLVHGRIDENAIYADPAGDNLPILCGLEWNCNSTKDPEIQARDVEALGKIVLTAIERNKSKYESLIYDLISDITNPDWRERPTPKEALEHPLFWDAEAKMKVFYTLNDLLCSLQVPPSLIQKFEDFKIDVMQCTSWMSLIPQLLVRDLRSRGDYAPDSLKDLVRMIRNKSEHRSEMSSELMDEIGSSEDKIFDFFDKKFPNLFLYCFHFYQSHHMIRCSR